MIRMLLALPLALAAPPAAAQTLPTGLYACTIGSAYLGDIAVKGEKYRGPAFDGVYEEPSYAYTADGPTIVWGGPLGGISLAGTVVSTVVKGGGDGVLDGFDVTIQNAESGNFQTVSCAGPG